MKALYLAVILSLTLGYAQAQSEGVATQPEKSDAAKSISIFPNPTSDFITVKLGQLEASKTKVIVFNILGNEIQVESEVIDDHEIRLKVKDFPTGYYLLAIRDEQTAFRGTYKFLKR